MEVGGPLLNGGRHLQRLESQTGYKGESAKQQRSSLPASWLSRQWQQLPKVSAALPPLPWQALPSNWEPEGLLLSTSSSCQFFGNKVGGIGLNPQQPLTVSHFATLWQTPDTGHPHREKLCVGSWFHKLQSIVPSPATLVCGGLGHHGRRAWQRMAGHRSGIIQLKPNTNMEALGKQCMAVLVWCP